MEPEDWPYVIITYTHTHNLQARGHHDMTFD